MKPDKTIINGLRILTTPLDSTEAVTLMVFVKAGSRSENTRTNGIAHFCEHMFFKGGKRFPNAKSMAEKIDGMGAYDNAYTYEEMVCFYIQTAAVHFETALDLLSDMVLNSRFDEEEIERERGVILQEIDACLDNPEELVELDWQRLIFGNQPLGWQILGPPENIRRFSRDNLMKFRRMFYGPEATVISVAGKIPENAVKLIEEYFPYEDEHGPDVIWKNFDENLAKQTTVALNERDIRQAYVLLGGLAPCSGHELEMPAIMLSKILGSGMSSRLFMEVRELSGLAYSVDNDYQRFTDAGYFCASAAVSPENAELVVRKILREYEKVRKDGITPGELRKVKGMYEGNFALSCESSRNIAEFFGMRELLHGRAGKTEDVVDKIRAVTLDEVNEAARLILDRASLALAIVGPFNDPEIFEKIMKK